MFFTVDKIVKNVKENWKFIVEEFISPRLNDVDVKAGDDEFNLNPVDFLSKYIKLLPSLDYRNKNSI